MELATILSKLFVLNDHSLWYTKTEKEADDVADELGLVCEIHETEPHPTIPAAYKYYVKWNWSETLDIIHKLRHLKPSFCGSVFYAYFSNMIPDMKYVKIHQDAIAPTKAHVSDTGYDLNLVDIKKTDPISGVIWYGTGVIVQPPPNYYMDLVPRSSMSKTGHFLVNSVGIIDQSYRGEIMVALKKVSENVEDLKLPNKCVQIIPRMYHHMQTVECKELNESVRGDGGFGSTS